MKYRYIKKTSLKVHICNNIWQIDRIKLNIKILEKSIG